MPLLLWHQAEVLFKASFSTFCKLSLKILYLVKSEIFTIRSYGNLYRKVENHVGHAGETVIQNAQKSFFHDLVIESSL